MFSPQFIEFGEEEHGAEVADRPEGTDDPGDSGLKKTDREANDFINVIESGESGFAGGEDSESDAIVLGEVEGKEVLEGEESVAHKKSAVKGFGEVGGAMTREMDDRSFRQS